jgi:Mrp family chromosome partitioning ATPase
MSAIDRAFIKAYSDETSQSRAHPAVHNPSASVEGTSAIAAQAGPAATAPTPRRSASRTKRTASAAAIRGAAQNPAAATQPNQAEAEAIAAVPPPPVASIGSSGKAKVVVGRQALKQLAETAMVPPPHAAFVHSRSAPARPVEPRPNAGVAVAVAPVASSAGRQLSENPRSNAPAPLATAQAAPQQLRVDPVISASAESPIAALEVDRLIWPPACDALTDRAGAELESVAAQLTDPGNDCGPTIAVLSIDEGHGGTTVALCLSRILAQRGTRVCLVDGDYRQPSLAESLGLDAERGLESVLSGEAALGEILVESLEDQLLVLPLARPMAADAVGRSKLRQTVTFGELRDQFDVVLIDAGSLGAAPALRPTMLGDGVIESVILVGRQTADFDLWQRARQALAEWNVPCMGAIVNRCAAQ